MKKNNSKKISLTLEDISDLIKKIYTPILAAVVGILLIITLILGYQYILKTVGAELRTDISTEEVNQTGLTEILGKLKARQEKMGQVWRSQYPDPFN